MDEIVMGCACGDTVIGDPVGESCAEPNCRARDNRGVAVFAAAGAVWGTARDFQYVSTAPPISSVTPSKGVIMLISKETCGVRKSEKDGNGNNLDQSYFSDNMQSVV